MRLIATLLVLAAAVPASAGVIGRNRYHALDPASGVNGVRKRLSPAAQRNVGAVAMILDTQKGGLGTGSFVAHDGKDRALVLTARHVGHSAGGLVIYKDEHLREQNAVIEHVVTSSGRLDYSLLAVKLPKRAKLPVLRLNQQGYDLGHSIYSSGFDTLALLYDPTLSPSMKTTSFSHTGRDVAFERMVRKSPTVQSIVSGEPLFHSRKSFKWIKPVTYLNMPTLNGGSGRPIFDATDHRVVGIMNGGYPSLHQAEVDQRTPARVYATGSASVSVSTREIIADVKAKRGRGIRLSDRPLIESMLASTK